MILDNSYFKGEIFIPNLSGANAVNTAISNEMEAFIEEYETDYLELMFGETMAVAIEAANTAGVTSIYDDVLEYLTAQTHGSPLANYVYFQFQRNNLTKTSGMGEIQMTSENANAKNSIHKLKRAWNKMVDMSQTLFDYVEEEKDTFPLYDSEISFPFEKINSFGI